MREPTVQQEFRLLVPGVDTKCFLQLHLRWDGTRVSCTNTKTDKHQCLNIKGLSLDFVQTCMEEIIISTRSTCFPWASKLINKKSTSSLLLMKHSLGQSWPLWGELWPVIFFAYLYGPFYTQSYSMNRSNKWLKLSAVPLTGLSVWNSGLNWVWRPSTFQSCILDRNREVICWPVAEAECQTWEVYSGKLGFVLANCEPFYMCG